jgi:hypothetical protein
VAEAVVGLTANAADAAFLRSAAERGAALATAISAVTGARHRTGPKRPVAGILEAAGG